MNDLPTSDPLEPSAKGPRSPAGDVRPLGIIATLAWAVLIFVVAQAVGFVIIWLSGNIPADTGIRYDGQLVAFVTLTTNPVQIALLAAVAQWRSGSNPLDYLGLTSFSWHDFVVGALAILAVVGAIDAASYLAGRDIVSSFQTESYTSARAEGWLLPLVLAVVVVGPAGEEILFRGVLFRGGVGPGWRGVIGVAAIALLWAGMHVQYDWLGIGQVFLTGLVLGGIRWHSGSTWLTIVLHMLVNLEGTLEAIAKIGWSGT